MRLPSLQTPDTSLDVLRASLMSHQLAINLRVPINSLEFNNSLEQLSELRKVAIIMTAILLQQKDTNQNQSR